MSAKKIDPALIKKMRRELNNFAWGMFLGEYKIFDFGKLPTPLVEDFIDSEEFLADAYDFIFKVNLKWKANYPNKPLRLNKLSPSSSRTPMPFVFPDLQSKQDFVPASPSMSISPNLPASTIIPTSEVQNLTPTTTLPNDAILTYGNSAGAKASSQNGNKNSEQSATTEHSTTVNTVKPGQIPVAGIPAAKPTSSPPTFHLPNAKVGVEYCAKIIGSSSDGKSVTVVSVNLSDELGLSFDSSTGELKGVPLKDGDHKISLQWKDGSTAYSSHVLLFVNPDPRSLWKVIEPPVEAIYPKTHFDKKLIQESGFQIAAASRRGRSHEHAGSHRDDDFFIAHDKDTTWSVIIVADGAGSAKCSRHGSKLAVDITGKYIQDNLIGDFGSRMTTSLVGWEKDTGATALSMGAEFYYLFHRAGELAVEAIEQEAKEKSFTPKDYSTTLLVAVVKRVGNETFLATFWMGDGAIAAYGPRGNVRLMGVPDSGEYAGQTRFLDRSTLSDPGCSKRVGIGRYSDITSVILMTDGVSDPRFETDNGLADGARWDALWDEIKPSLDAANPENMLVDWLSFFSQGNHDDRTIALLW